MNTRTKRRDPIQTAKELLAKHKVTTVPVPIERIAKLEGAKIQFGPLDRELSGMFFVKEGVAMIGVNSLHHPNRQRFTIGHELGHMFLHRDQIEGDVHVDKEHAMLRRDTVSASGTDQIEIEANQFAGYMLVPDELLEALLKDYPLFTDNEQELEGAAKKFKVSVLMMQLRVRRWLADREAA